MHMFTTNWPQNRGQQWPTGPTSRVVYVRMIIYAEVLSEGHYRVIGGLSIVD